MARRVRVRRRGPAHPIRQQEQAIQLGQLILAELAERLDQHTVKDSPVRGGAARLEKPDHQ